MDAVWTRAGLQTVVAIQGVSACIEQMFAYAGASQKPLQAQQSP